MTLTHESVAGVFVTQRKAKAVQVEAEQNTLLEIFYVIMRRFWFMTKLVGQIIELIGNTTTGFQRNMLKKGIPANVLFKFISQ